MQRKSHVLHNAAMLTQYDGAAPNPAIIPDLDGVRKLRAPALCPGFEIHSKCNIV